MARTRASLLASTGIARTPSACGMFKPQAWELASQRRVLKGDRLTLTYDGEVTRLVLEDRKIAKRTGRWGAHVENDLVYWREDIGTAMSSNRAELNYPVMGTTEGSLE